MTDLRSSARRAVRAWGVVTAWSRPFPDALVIGAKRSGTTSLWRALEAHPAVLPLFPSARVLPLRANQKGVHYYDREFRRGSSWYRSHFASGAHVALRRRTAGAALTCEASPGYLAHPGAAARVARDMPDARLVVMLRHPVQRAYSHWKEQVRNGHEVLDFEDAIAAEPERLRQADATGDALGLLLEHYGYVAQSRYDIGLTSWRTYFPAARLLVLYAEQYFAQPGPTMDRIADFLGIDRLRSYAVRPENAATGTDLAPGTAASLWGVLQDAVHAAELHSGTAAPWSP
jgi:sulfotransferase family protein